MTTIGKLTTAERTSVLAAQRKGYLRPMSLDMVEAWPTAIFVRSIKGWVIRDNVGVVRDACGPIHRN